MSQSRLSLALEQGLVSQPEGGVAVLRPPMGFDLSAFDKEQVHVSHSFRPDHDYWRDMGYATGTSAEPAGLAVVVVPRSKALARALVAEAAGLAPLVVIDGQKTDGVDSLFKDIRKKVGELASITKSHGRLFAIQSASIDLSAWAEPEPIRGPDGFITRAGVFSEGGVDRGSALLAATLPAKLPGRVADLGAGWGYLSAAILKCDGVTHLDLIEAEAMSLDCARKNIPDPRAAFHWADATRWTPDVKYGAVVCNPPFHVGRNADTSLGRSFIAAAAGMLNAGGQLWLVANRHLPYETTLRERFVKVEEVSGDSAFKVFHAVRPRK